MRLHLKEGAVAPKDRFGNEYPNAVIDYVNMGIVRGKMLSLTLGVFKDNEAADALLAPIHQIDLVFGANATQAVLDATGNVVYPANGGAGSVIFALDFNFNDIEITHDSAKAFILAHRDPFAQEVKEETPMGIVNKHFSLGDNYEFR